MNNQKVKSYKKIECLKRMIAIGLIAGCITGLTGCGTSLNGAVSKDGNSVNATEVTQQTNQTGETETGTEKYLDVAGATEADFSKYDQSSTKPQAQSSADSNSSDSSKSAQGSSSGAESQTNADNANGVTFDATKGSSTTNVPADSPGNKSADVKNDSKTEYTCTLIVTCATILDHKGDLAAGKESLIPSDGIIYSNQKVTFSKGETVFDVLKREMKAKRIQLEFTSVPSYNSDYIEGINNLYEFDCGQNSGWKYSVNGEYPNYGCSQYELKDQDVVQWAYTCDLGKDLEKK